MVEQVQLDQLTGLLVEPEQDATSRARRGGHERIDRREGVGIYGMQDLDGIARLGHARAQALLLLKPGYQRRPRLARDKAGYALSERVKLAARGGAHQEVQPHRKQRGLPTRESASQSLDLLQRSGEIVVDRPAICCVVTQGATQPPALEFQALGGWTTLEGTQVQAEIDWQPLGENAIEPARCHNRRQVGNDQHPRVLAVEYQVVVADHQRRG